MLKLVIACIAIKRDRRGVTALECGLIAALIAVAIISGVTSLGSSVNHTFSTVAAKMTTANK